MLAKLYSTILLILLLLLTFAYWSARRTYRRVADHKRVRLIASRRAMKMQVSRSG